MKNTIQILETTLRDGSYAIDFRFTPKDTAIIASALEQVGFRLIEIGHGLGLHAKEMGKGDAAATDAEYLETAVSVLKKAQFGMFCIPGISRLEDIDMAGQFGMHFIRIGTNITELKGTEEYFERAKKHGMFISSNLMKSYAVPPKEFGEYTKLAQSYGADIVVLVDSAGGLFPKDIEEYFVASRQSSDIALGFHGHNNLGLANANTLKAIELGASIVDTSLKGIGRSAGNAATEMMVMILKRLGYRLDVDEYAIMDVAEQYITPLLHGLQNTPLSITGGYAQFHSSYLGTILKFAQKYHIDPRELIVKVTERDKVHVPEALVKSLAHEIKQERETTSKRLVFPAFEISQKGTPYPEEQIQLIIKEVVTEAKKKGKKSVFNIVLSDEEKNQNFISQFIQESALFITGSAEICESAYIIPLIPHIDGKVEYILLDTSLKRATDREIVIGLLKMFTQSKVLLYNDLLLWSKSVVSLITYLLGNVIEQKLAIYGDNFLAHYIHEQMIQLGATAVILKEISQTSGIFQHCKVLISCDCLNKLKKDMLREAKEVELVIDAKINSIEQEGIEYLHEREIRLIRSDMRSAVAGEILHQIGSCHLVAYDLGRAKIQGYTVISGGLIGKRGEIIVDSINSPSQVIGVAQGNGEVNYQFDQEQQEVIEKIKRNIYSI